MNAEGCVNRSSDGGSGFGRSLESCVSRSPCAVGAKMSRLIQYMFDAERHGLLAVIVGVMIGAVIVGILAFLGEYQASELFLPIRTPRA